MKRNVPYWYQTSTASCGPASLLMILNYYNPKYGLSREKEWALWRECCMLVWRGAHPYGLAIPALRKGMKVTLMREKRAAWKDHDFPDNNESLRYAIASQEKEAKRLGLREKLVRRITLKHLAEILGKGLHPIIMMNLVEKNGKIGFIHWAVVLGLGKDYITINDPGVSGNRKMPLKLFMMAWDGVRMKKWNTGKEVIIVEK